MGLQRAHRVPGDQLRPDRPDVGHGHHRRHDCEDRRRSARASQGIPVPVPAKRKREGKRHMAKKSAVNRNERVKQLVKQYAAKRDALKAIANDESLPLEERFEARLKLAELPRNSSKTRIRNRCEVTGPSARLLPQAEDEPDRAARPRVRRARSPASSSRAGRRVSHGQRPHRRSDRPHQERRHAQAAQGLRRRLRRCARASSTCCRRRLHPRLPPGGEARRLPGVRDRAEVLRRRSP